MNEDVSATNGTYERGDLGVFETLFINTRQALDGSNRETDTVV